jgi:hypothetical protein
LLFVLKRKLIKASMRELVTCRLGERPPPPETLGPALEPGQGSPETGTHTIPVGMGTTCAVETATRRRLTTTRRVAENT